MTAVTQWESLLGLPLEDALERAAKAGQQAEVAESCAPRRTEIAAGTLRVIRVQKSEAGLKLTVSAFMDGNPRKM